MTTPPTPEQTRHAARIQAVNATFDEFETHWDDTDEPDSHMMDEAAEHAHTVSNLAHAHPDSVRPDDLARLDDEIAHWEDLDEHDLSCAVGLVENASHVMASLAADLPTPNAHVVE